MYDLLIRNGTLIDGSGSPMFHGDVAVHDDEIVAIGSLGSSPAHRVIDASGLYVSPGFIDVNNHSDTYWQLLADPRLESLLRQGITTIIGGNSGSSLAPLTDPSIIRSIQKWTDIQKITFNWLSMEEFLAEVDRRQPGVNFATLIGHGTLRRGVMRDQTRAITPEEILFMERMLKTALKQGGVGLSTGLLYTHAKDAKARELGRLARLVAKEKGVYATYLRDETSGLVAAVEEAISVANESGATLHISHLKAVGEEHWDLFPEAISRIENAALEGVPVTFDVYPYTVTGSVLYTLLPEWITREGRKMMLHRLRDAVVRASVVSDMRKQKIDYARVLISSSSISKMLSRRRVSDIAKLQGVAPEEALIDILLASDGRAIVSLDMLSPKNVDLAVCNPFSVIASNGVGYSKEHEKTGELVHPRNFGAFPKVLAEYVRERGLLSWEEAIRKMTGRPAEIFGLRKRGFLRRGFAADIVVFDPKTIRDSATLENPYQYAEGITYVIVNGRLAVENGQGPSGRFGTVLTHKRPFFPWQ